MKTKLLMLIILMSSLLLTSCVPADKQCSVDDDCVPVTCCHASDAVNRESGPDCSGKLCTANCQEGTIDCNQGEVKCLDKECQVVFN
jgi:hypothetical protein